MLPTPTAGAAGETEEAEMVGKHVLVGLAIAALAAGSARPDAGRELHEERGAPLAPALPAGRVRDPLLPVAGDFA